VEVDVPKLRRLRVDAGYSQRELARRAGVAPGTIWKIEQGRRATPATLKRLADVLGVKASDLLKES
jgi:transcriptional regulator with XRE-family HTH domain